MVKTSSECAFTERAENADKMSVDGTQHEQEQPQTDLVAQSAKRQLHAEEVYFLFLFCFFIFLFFYVLLLFL